VDWIRDQLRKGLNVRTYALVVLLIGVLAWIQSLDAKRGALRARASATVAAVVVPVLPASAARGGASLAEATPAGWGNDPFARRVGDAGESAPPRSAPRGAREARPVGLYLQGIMNGPLGRSALINGTAYREGERIGSREVLQIGTRSVLILDGGTVTTLHFKGDG
jgi:hypothetical protein